MRRMKTILLLAAGAACGLAAAPASAQKQTLHMAYWAGPSHQMVQTLESWIKTVEEASGGNLTIEMDKAAIGKMEGQYDLVKNGVIDPIHRRDPVHRSGKLPISKLIAIGRSSN